MSGPRFACVLLPRLAVQTVLRERYGDGGADVPLGLFRRAGEQRRGLTGASAAAEGLGIRAGMTVSAAEGIYPDLVLVDDTEAQPGDALLAVADALHAFGPIVATELELPGDGGRQVLSEAVWVDTARVHGVEVSVSALVGCVRALGLQAVAAIATTPSAALALAHAAARGASGPVERLPLRDAQLPPRAYEALHVVGIRTIGAFLALSPSGIDRRFGPVAGALHRALRGAEGVLVPTTVPQTFAERFAFESAIEGREPLGFPLKAGVDRLMRRLVGRGLGMRAMLVELELETFGDPEGAFLDALGMPAQAPPRRHTLDVSMGLTTQDGALVRSLLDEQLARYPPPAGVLGLTLTIIDAAPIAPCQLDLFAEPEPRESIAATAARLASLLGDDVLHPVLVEDFRPERAWTLRPPGGGSLDASGRGVGPSSGARAPLGPRPTRLYREPKALEAHMASGDAPPGGALSGPERLVTGWWDETPAAREYWVVADRWGRRAWVFRDLGTGRWYQHGVFD